MTNIPQNIPSIRPSIHPSTPNILLIMCDQWRADCLSSLGHPDVQTPHLDSVASDGVTFRRATTQSPLCTPSRMSFLSGRYVHQHGCDQNWISLWPETPNVVRSVRDAGYQTANRGKLHLYWRHDNELLMSEPMLNEFGFTDPLETTGKCSQGKFRASAYSEHLRNKGLLTGFWSDLWEKVRTRNLGVAYGKSILSSDDHIDAWLMDRGRAYVTEHAADKKPWFLWVGPPGPHDPFDPPGDWAEMYDPSSLDAGLRRFSENPLAKTRADLMRVKDASDDEIRRMRALYYGGISFIDHKIGQMVQDLKDQHLYDDTWIIFTADHGEFLGDFHLTTKGHFHWQADRIPLIIKPPASLRGAPRNAASDALVEFIDVATTIRDIAGGELSGDQGRSLLPVLSGNQPLNRHRDVVHSQIGNTFMMMTETRKIIFQDKDAPAVKAFFDVQEDPEELHNILDQSTDEVSRMISTVIDPFFSETSDLLPPPWVDISPWQQWDRYPHLDMLERL